MDELKVEMQVLFSQITDDGFLELFFVGCLLKRAFVVKRCMFFETRLLSSKGSFQ